MLWQYLIPQQGISRLVGRLAHSEVPWLKNWFIRSFIARYGVDMSLAQEPDPSRYRSFNDFFTRALKAGVRPIPSEENVIACPVDGSISQMGNVENGRIFQAKNHSFSLIELLGGSIERAAPFAQGQFATIYLAPKDYHRVHMPCLGKLEEMTYIPGKVFSVNRQSAAEIPELFARNERVVALFKTAFGPMAIILVGAMIVASIETVWAGLVAPGKPRRIQTWRYTDSEVILPKGSEMGRFQLGSTVILLVPNATLQWEKSLGPDDSVIMGQKLAVLNNTLSSIN